MGLDHRPESSFIAQSSSGRKFHHGTDFDRYSFSADRYSI